MLLSNEVEGFLNLTLSLINPGLFKCGLNMLKKLRGADETKKISSEWQSVYTGVAVISNRVTPSHRDSKGRPAWYDTLANYCNEDSRPRLLIKDLGMDLKYSSGTVVSLCGSVFEHEVRSWARGDRACYAHFMRESVRKSLEVDPAGWVCQDMYGSSNWIINSSKINEMEFVFYLAFSSYPFQIYLLGWKISFWEWNKFWLMFWSQKKILITWDVCISQHGHVIYCWFLSGDLLLIFHLRILLLIPSAFIS